MFEQLFWDLVVVEFYRYEELANWNSSCVNDREFYFRFGSELKMFEEVRSIGLNREELVKGEQHL